MQEVFVGNRLVRAGSICLNLIMNGFSLGLMGHSLKLTRARGAGSSMGQGQENKDLWRAEKLKSHEY